MARVIIIPSSSTSSSSTNLIHNYFLKFPKPPCSSSISLFLKPFCFSSSISYSNSRFQSFVVKSISSIEEVEPILEEEDEEEVEIEGFEESSEMGLGDKEEETEKVVEKKKKPKGSVLKLSIKDKKELASYAHSLGDKLKCQLVGKSGVTDSVVFSFLETLEKNELLKVKIRKTSPDEMDDAIRHLEDATGSVAVSQIGRTVILYRPSPTKMKKEAVKKEMEQKWIQRKQNFANSRPTRPPYRREYSERPDGRGRRGGSRVATTA